MLTPRRQVRDAVALVEDGAIRVAGSRAEVEVPAGARVVEYPAESVLAPGLVDLHIHGAAGHDVMEGEELALREIETFLARHGVTSYLPTTVTAPLDDTLRALDRLAEHIEAWEPGGVPRARPLGIHLEGPFLSHAKRGVHPPEHLLRPTLGAFERLWEAAQGRLLMMTVAPELEGAEQVIAAAARHGVAVSLGHSDAGTEAALAAVRAGACHATHTFNAMRALAHRDPGVLGVALAEPITADIIADGIHVHPAVLRMFLAAKGAERAVLITDATSATGLGDGRYRLGGFQVEVSGGCSMAEGRLAGSVLTLDRAVRNVMEFAGWPLGDALRLAGENPARVIGRRKGVIEPGADADLVVMTSAGEVQQAIVAGRAAT